MIPCGSFILTLLVLAYLVFLKDDKQVLLVNVNLYHSLIG